MRKLAIVLAVVMLMSCLALPAMAVEPRMTTIVPELYFDGATASCYVSITGNDFSEHLVATVKLYQGDTVIATWVPEGDGYVFFSDTATVSRGYTYKLEVALSVDGDPCTPVHITKDYV